ncbi:MAG: hypothetical protein JF924_12575 [Candidatus Dormibacteraeota bacterium]|nr:hypothetical protein [Candidatus Dormibacteraeota bacterium]
MLVISKLAVGTATIALALSASVVAAAAFSGSRPMDWGHAVKVVVDRCQIDQNDPGSQLGPCVSSFIPSGLPLKPTVGHSGDSTQTTGGHGTTPTTAASAPNRSRNGQSAGTRPTPTSGASPSEIPIISGQPGLIASGNPTPAPTNVAAATPVPSPTETPLTTPTPSPTPVPTPVPTPSPTAPSSSGGNPDPSPSPPPPTPTPVPVPSPTP